MTYRLTRKARDDLIEIYLYGFDVFGEAQADAYHDMLARSFDRLAGNPFLARERREIDPPVRIHPCGAHVIVYVEEAGGVLIVRIRHGREDWRDDPQRD